MDQNQFQEINKTIKNINYIVSFIPPVEDKNTFLSIINKPYHENTISNYLAFFLDYTKNSLAKILCSRLVELFNTQFVLDFNDFDQQREYSLPSNSRIDILIKTRNAVIAIENKILSKENDKQTDKYFKQLKEEFNDIDIFPIYLSTKKENISSQNFKIMSYDMLLDILKSIEFDAIRNEKTYFFLKDFIDHIEEYLMSNKPFMLSEKSKLYLDNYDVLTDLEKSFDTDAEKFFHRIEETFRNIFSEGVWELNFKPNRVYQQIYKNNWQRKEIFVHIEFFIDKRSLIISDQLYFVLEVENKKLKSKFKDLFIKKYGAILPMEMESKDINNKNLASKYYEFDKKFIDMDLSEIETHVTKIYEDFIFFEKKVDSILEIVLKK